MNHDLIIFIDIYIYIYVIMWDIPFIGCISNRNMLTTHKIKDQCMH